MQMLRRRAYARAGLVGNPSDGYHGRTLSVIVRDYWAEVVLYPWDDVEIVLSQEDKSRFRSVHDLVHDIDQHGYYGGIRLAKAAIKKFVEYCRVQGHDLHDQNFSLRYQSNIPRQVGLAGSSAIVVATLRCLMDFYEIDIPRELQPSLALSVETEELGIDAGLQDRVIQVYEGFVSMNFSREAMQERQGFTYGEYEPIDLSLLPPLYIAYTELGQSSPKSTFVAHDDIRTRNRDTVRERYLRGEENVVRAMKTFANLAADAREAVHAGDIEALTKCIDTNFDTRRTIYPEMLPGQIDMIERARSVGAGAKFAGSGGAIIGTYRDEQMFEQLERELGGIGCRVFKPQIAQQ